MSVGAPLRTIVLDDDPTGTQSAADVTVLLEHDPAELGAILERHPSVYVQTNSRALDEASAVALATRIRSDAETIARRLGVRLRFVLRGDSTLRGHVFAESSVFLDEGAVLLFAPAFPAGGRTTVDGTHFVDLGSGAVPVAMTEFARDPVFGFGTSELVDFATQRSGRPAVSVGLDDVRGGELGRVLLDASAGAVVIPDVASDADIEHIARTVESISATRRIVVRSAAPLAAELAGVRSRGLLDASELGLTGRTLVVCGSHTAGAAAQLARLADAIGPPCEIDPALARRDSGAAGRAVADAERTRTRPRGTRFVSTPRERAAADATLEAGAAVMSALVAAARQLIPDCDAVITKGGITSAETLRRVLGARRGFVLGQLEAGISVWSVEADDGRMRPVVVVPGNMGAPDVLRRLWESVAAAPGS